MYEASRQKIDRQASLTLPFRRSCVVQGNVLCDARCWLHAHAEGGCVGVGKLAYETTGSRGANKATLVKLCCIQDNIYFTEGAQSILAYLHHSTGTAWGAFVSLDQRIRCSHSLSHSDTACVVCCSALHSPHFVSAVLLSTKLVYINSRVHRKRSCGVLNKVAIRQTVLNHRPE